LTKPLSIGEYQFTLNHDTFGFDVSKGGKVNTPSLISINPDKEMILCLEMPGIKANKIQMKELAGLVGREVETLKQSEDYANMILFQSTSETLNISSTETVTFKRVIFPFKGLAAVENGKAHPVSDVFVKGSKISINNGEKLYKAVSVTRNFIEFIQHADPLMVWRRKMNNRFNRIK
jgi:hypothetical protein